MITIATGKYERPTYEVICSICGEMYTQKRKPIENPKCKKCQKKYHSKKYYEANKEKYVVDPNIKRERDKKYYEKHKDSISQKRKKYYEENKEHILKRCTEYRRSKGELPNRLSGTEKIALKFIEEIFPNKIVRTRDRNTIKNPRTNAYLELDFYLPEINLAIELNGITHYKPIYGQDKFLRQQRNDELKRKLCKKQGITLIEIPLEEGVHYDRYSIEHKRLKETINRFLDDKEWEVCTWKDHLH